MNFDQRLLALDKAIEIAHLTEVDDPETIVMLAVKVDKFLSPPEPK